MIVSLLLNENANSEKSKIQIKTWKGQLNAIKSTIKIQKKNLQVGKLGKNKDYKEITNAGCGEKRPLVHCWWECKLVQ